MYDFIYDPKNREKYAIDSDNGLKILRGFLQEGGKRIGSGSYKCVFSPSLKCQGSSSRYTESGKNEDAYVGALMGDKKDIQQEIKEDKVLKKIDPKRNFTIPILKTCEKVVAEDSPGFEEDHEFDECPFKVFNWDNSINKDITQLIYKKGGEDLSNVLINLKSRIVKIFSNGSKSKVQREKAIINILVNIVVHFKNILNGLCAINKQTFSHRDIKPQNILYDYDKYHIIDFGSMSSFHQCLIDTSSEEIYKSHSIDYDDSKYYYRYWPVDIGVAYLLLHPDEEFDFSDDPSQHDYTLPDPHNPNRTKKNIIELFKKYKGKSNEGEFCRESITKFDVFSVSVAMHEYFPTILTKMLTYVNSLGIKHSMLTKLKTLKPKLDTLISEGLTFDPMDRPTIKKFTKKFSSITKILKSGKVRSPVLSVTISPNTPTPKFKKKKTT